jgi:hypothetical protein
LELFAILVGNSEEEGIAKSRTHKKRRMKGIEVKDKQRVDTWATREETRLHIPCPVTSNPPLYHTPPAISFNMHTHPRSLLRIPISGKVIGQKPL